MSRRAMPLCAVVRIEEEWRTSGRRSVGRHHRPSYGRTCLWIKLACGNCVQRMVKLDKHGDFTPPKRVRCDQCPRRAAA